MLIHCSLRQNEKRRQSSELGNARTKARYCEQWIELNGAGKELATICREEQSRGRFQHPTYTDGCGKEVERPKSRPPKNSPLGNYASPPDRCIVDMVAFGRD